MKFDMQTRPGITKFQSQVYQIVAEIPKGKVSTYKIIHIQLLKSSIKSSPRAVGQALRRNIFGYRNNGSVPCHRVVSTDLKVHGFYGKIKSDEKLELLSFASVRYRFWNKITL